MLAFALAAPAVAAPPVQSVALLSDPRCGAHGAEHAPLTLVVNGVTQGIAIVLLCGDDVYVTVADLVGSDVVLPASLRMGEDPGSYVSAASLAPGIAFHLDLADLTLVLNADPRLLPRTSVSLAQHGANEPATAARSGFLNYTVSSTVGSRARTTSGFFQAGVSAGAAQITSTGEFAGRAWHRGLTAASFESQSKLTRFTLGEELAATGGLGGSAVVAGVGYARHFEFQPDYVYYPTAGVSGTVLTPTTADIYVNGAYLRTVSLPPGQFDLSQIPVPPGSSVTSVVLHDARGGTQTIGNVFYSSRSLLRRGLTDFDYHLGFLRPDPFGTDDRYGAFAALGTYRVGLTDDLSAGLRLERTAHLFSGGPSVDFALPFGQLGLEAGASSADGLRGDAFGASYQVQNARYALTLSAQTMSANYATASLSTVAGRTRSAIAQTLSVPISRTTALDLNHTTTTSTGLPATDHTSVGTTVRVRRDLSLSLDAARDRGGSILGLSGPRIGDRWTLGASAALRLGRESNAYVSAVDTAGATATELTVAKDVPSTLGFGYMVDATTGSGNAQAGSLTVHAPSADFQLLANATGGSPSSATAIVSGALVAFEQGVFLTPPTGAGYALAQTNGFPGVDVFMGDRFAGRTDRNGNLVVTNLTPYGRNAIAIDEMKDRTDVVQDSPQLFVKPKLDAGVVAPFRIRRFHAYVGRVVVERGGATIIPAYGIMTLTQGGVAYESDLGTDGQFYYDGPPGGAFAGTVLWTGGTCAFSGTLAVPSQTVTHVGVLVCASR